MKKPRYCLEVDGNAAIPNLSTADLQAIANTIGAFLHDYAPIHSTDDFTACRLTTKRELVVTPEEA